MPIASLNVTPAVALKFIVNNTSLALTPAVLFHAVVIVFPSSNPKFASVTSIAPDSTPVNSNPSTSIVNWYAAMSLKFAAVTATLTSSPAATEASAISRLNVPALLVPAAIKLFAIALPLTSPILTPKKS